MKLLISPHPDDAVLFASFTLLKEHPLVVTVFDSCRQANAQERRAEDEAAMLILGCTVQFLGMSDVTPSAEWIERELLRLERPEVVYAPAFEEEGHPQHNLIAKVAERVFGRVVSYMTYTRRGKSLGRQVEYGPLWPALKLRALACYESQIARADNRDHFLREQYEYYQ